MKLLKMQNFTLKTKVNNLDKKIPNGTALIHINQYNTDKQNLDKKIGEVDKKIPRTSGLLTATVLNTKIKKLRTKCQILVVLATTVLNTKCS